MEKVKLVNMIHGPLDVLVREIPFKHTWLGYGASFDVEKATVEQLMYDNGFRYMIDTGMLYIEDLEVKKDLGIEPEDAVEPVNVIVLDDKQRRQYMVNLSLPEFKEKVKKLNLEQVNQLVDYAAENRLADFDKADFLKSICGKDVIKMIQLNAQNKEA